jgi:hypothetical protein
MGVQVANQQLTIVGTALQEKPKGRMLGQWHIRPLAACAAGRLLPFRHALVEAPAPQNAKMWTAMFHALLLVTCVASREALSRNYTYRAQKNNVDLTVACTALKYGFANLTVVWEAGDEEGEDGNVTGSITGFVNETTSGEKWLLNLTGTWRWASAVQRKSVAFDWAAEGPVNGLQWKYAYVGVSLSPWYAYSAPSQQQHTLVGSVVRLVGHGLAPAGEAASFYAVEKTE